MSDFENPWFYEDPEAEREMESATVGDLIETVQYKINDLIKERDSLDIKKNNLTWKTIISAVTFLVCILIYCWIYRFIFIFFIVGVVITIAYGLFLLKLLKDFLGNLLELLVFTEFLFKKYITSHRLACYYNQYEYYTQTVLLAERKLAPFRRIDRKLQAGEELTEKEQKMLAELDMNEFRVAPNPFREEVITLGGIFDYIGG